MRRLAWTGRAMGVGEWRTENAGEGLAVLIWIVGAIVDVGAEPDVRDSCERGWGWAGQDVDGDDEVKACCHPIAVIVGELQFVEVDELCGDGVKMEGTVRLLLQLRRRRLHRRLLGSFSGAGFVGQCWWWLGVVVVVLLAVVVVVVAVVRTREVQSLNHGRVHHFHQDVGKKWNWASDCCCVCWVRKQ